MNKEEKLQSEIVIEFSQRFPKKYGRLIHVSNERNNKRQVYISKSIGIVPGVSDMLYLSKKLMMATELKVPGSRHDVSKIKIQVWWGRIWESCGKKFHWRLCRTKEEAVSCYLGKFKGLTLDDVEKMLNNTKTKTIKF